jgi:simple sugar transport system permease protein
MIGAICGAAAALYLPQMPIYLHLAIIFLLSFLGGAIWGGIAGFMRAYFSVNEILSTVMLNYIAIQIYTFFIRGPMIDPQEIKYGTGIPQTAALPRELWLGTLMMGTRLHSGIILAVVLAVLVYIFLWKTPFGYRMRAVGAEAKAARDAGIDVQAYLFRAMLLAGGFAGLAGAVEVCGVHHRGLESISAGYGFSGIVVALFGGLHPLGIIPASVLFGLLIIGADMMQRTVEVPASIVMAIQGLIILAIVGSQIFLTHEAMRETLLNKLGLRKKKTS